MPPLDEALRSVLGCPLCKGPLTVHEEASRTEVRCPRCHSAWPVEEGVPRMVPERQSRTAPEPG
ncbi:Trm112 family protein [Pyxidicoccus sp. MSG2]|uniref:Trm112 family protein n=1 Tax=Pyxidicoccus sp. MSG2 TaxID=2996790 RepID=UPI002D1E3653|nr:Trm112 family protein [Pyxidicoccus sp. MSG2]